MKNADIEKRAAEHNESEAVAEIKSYPRIPQIDFWIKSDRRLLHCAAQLVVRRRKIARTSEVLQCEYRVNYAEQDENA